MPQHKILPFPSAGKPKLLDQVRIEIRRRHYSPRTEEAYVGWIKRYIRFHGIRHPAEMGKPEVEAFLSHLAVGSKEGFFWRQDGEVQRQLPLWSNSV